MTQDQIAAGLKKVGPCSPGALADHLEVKLNALGYHLKKMIDAGTIKAAGNSNARRLGLPDQDLSTAAEYAPPPAPQDEEARQAQAPRGQGEGRATARAGRRSTARRSLHPGDRRYLAPGDRQRRRAHHLQRGADRGDRHAAFPALQRGVT